MAGAPLSLSRSETESLFFDGPFLGPSSFLSLFLGVPGSNSPMPFFFFCSISEGRPFPSPYSEMPFLSVMIGLPEISACMPVRVDSIPNAN